MELLDRGLVAAFARCFSSQTPVRSHQRIVLVSFPLTSAIFTAVTIVDGLQDAVVMSLGLTCIAFAWWIGIRERPRASRLRDHR